MADNKTQFTNEQLDNILAALDQRVKEKAGASNNAPVPVEQPVAAKPRTWTNEEVAAICAANAPAPANKDWEDRVWDTVTIAGGVAGGIGIVSLIAYLFKK